MMSLATQAPEYVQRRSDVVPNVPKGACEVSDRNWGEVLLAGEGAASATPTGRVGAPPPNTCSSTPCSSQAPGSLRLREVHSVVGSRDAGGALGKRRPNRGTPGARAQGRHRWQDFDVVWCECVPGTSWGHDSLEWVGEVSSWQVIAALQADVHGAMPARVERWRGATAFDNKTHDR